MTWDTDSVTKEGLLEALRAAGAIAPGTLVRIEPFPRNFGRKDAHSKLAFRVWAGDETAFHLTVGRSLSGLRAKAEAFAHAVPDIACKPLFFHQATEYELFGQEFFGATNIEEGLARRMLSEEAWCEAVSTVKARLEATSMPSSPARLFEELDALQKGILETPGFASPDQAFLEEAVFPIIRHGASLLAPRMTWTNGDFIARNILFDVRGGYRLVDTEFAEMTHFGELDWLRLELFSHIPKDAKSRIIHGGRDTPRWYSMLCWLQHALRLSEVFLPEVVDENLTLIAEKLVRLVKAEGSLPRLSMFHRALASEQNGDPAGHTDDAQSVLKLEWSRNGSLSPSTTASLPVKDGVLGELEFELKAGSGKRLLGRIVLPPAPASIEIRRIGLRSANDGSLLWGAEGAELAAQLRAEGDACSLSGADGARFISLGGRSAVVLPQVDLAGHREGLALSLWLRLGFSAAHFARQAPMAFGSDGDCDSGPATAQLFFPSGETEKSSYSDDRSQYAEIERTGAWNEVSFPTPALPVGSVLRLDPSDRPGFLEISRISLELAAEDRTGAFEIDLLSIEGLSAHGDCSALTHAVPFQFLAFGADPYLLLPPLPAAAADHPGRLVVTLRFAEQAPPQAWCAELRRQQQAVFEAVGRANALREELIQNTERHRHEAALAAREATARLEVLEARHAEHLRAIVEDADKKCHAIQDAANRTVDEAYKAAAEGHRVATESNRAAEAAKQAAAEAIRAASLANAESVRAAYEAAAEAHRVATESNRAAEAAKQAAAETVREANEAAARRIQEAVEDADKKARAIQEAADRTIKEAYEAAAEAHRIATESNHAAEEAKLAAAVSVRDANEDAATRIRLAEEDADRKCRAIQDAADRTIHEAYAAAAEAHRIATESNHAAEAAKQAAAEAVRAAEEEAARQVALLESDLSALRLKLDGATESLYAQNERLLDYAHRSGLAAIEFKNLENSLADSVRLEADLRAELGRVTQESAAFREALASTRAELSNSQAEAAALQRDLTEIRGRRLVRIDSAFRKKRPATQRN